MQTQSLTSTNFYFQNQTSFYRGKVRDVYGIGNDKLIIVATDRISAFDHVLPKSIPFKGQVLTQVANLFLDLTSHIIPNWKISNPDPHVTIGWKCDAIPIEFVVRNYLTGHAWRVYKSGGRVLCGVNLPEGMKENDKFPHPIITPATKATSGHDEDTSYEEILSKNIISKEHLDYLYQKSIELFNFGTEYATKQGLILVDTKYEFGIKYGQPMLIDEIHTPDSSRFFYLDSYEQLQSEGKPQKQLSKEFVREWLMENGFQGLEGQLIPNMTEEWLVNISSRYLELYKAMVGKDLEKRSYSDIYEKIEQSILLGISSLEN
ncbi:MAG: phosphoribosylaminoimidazolesuccinocarboxamide synthase [Bacteroidia bacterium]|nr:phosphoribosylaminoimidazolesuccinocarboxamide synthase [Bacteroidia bacterium]